jgi:hypothetical protein
VRGLLVRHLVLPEGLAGTREVARFLAREVSPDTYVNVMGQYRPDNRAWQHPQLKRPITRGELADAVGIAREEGLSRFDERWVQAQGQGQELGPRPWLLVLFLVPSSSSSPYWSPDVLLDGQELGGVG